MQKTYEPKKKEVKRAWYIVDAKNKILGRLAAKVAPILRGKHKPMFCTHLDTGDGVIVINASKVRVSVEKKLRDKVYRRYSGYPGGLKEIPLATMLERRPATVIRLAVQRMLPGGPLGRDMIKKLKVYANEEHPHISQAPKPLEV